jgi:hypothetical protein
VGRPAARPLPDHRQRRNVLNPCNEATTVGGVPAWPFALACLPLGFAVAEVTGIRAAGGIVMAVVALLAVRAAAAPRPQVTAWVGVALACFVASHLLADVLGSWGAIAVVAVVTGGAGALLLDRRPQTAW